MERLHFLFPADPFRPREVDDAFGAQANALRQQGFELSTFTFDESIEGIHGVRPAIPAGSTVVYRGWMATPAEYTRMVALIESHGARALTSAAAYLTCHHLPNWYPLVERHTAETYVIAADADPTAAFERLGWEKYFLKDYVKSLKTETGSVASSPAQAQAIIDQMRMYRGTIEGGICIRRFEAFQPNTERRFFVIDGTAFSMAGNIPDIVRECARAIPSRFFSVDVALRDDGVLRVVEIGDGQVSDLVGWEADHFARHWRTQFPNHS